MTLSVTDLTCLRADHLVFEGLSFSLEPGNSLWVRGKNGAGKSSLLRICAKLLKPAAGSIHWHGTDILSDDESYHGQYHYLGHQDALKPVLTVRENLSFWSHFHGESNLEAALGDFDLLGLADTRVEYLSAGQKKRVSLARLTSSSAPLWILDEPISSLDTDHITLFKKRLTEHINTGGMALFATHQDLGLTESSTLNLDGKVPA